MAKRVDARPAWRGLGGETVATAAWRLDHEHVPCCQLRAVGARQVLAPAVGTFHPLSTDRGILPSLQAKGRHFASRGDDHCGHRLEKANTANRSVAATPPAGAPRPPTD